MKRFDNNVLKVLAKCSYGMFVVQQEFNIDCTCVDFTTKQPKDSCEKCLGTGKKIKIRKIEAAPQNNKLTFRQDFTNEIATTGKYYMKSDYNIKQGNIIVDADEVDVVQRIDPMKSDQHQPVYYMCETNPKKTNVQLFSRNFIKIVGRG